MARAFHRKVLSVVLSCPWIKVVFADAVFGPFWRRVRIARTKVLCLFSVIIVRENLSSIFGEGEADCRWLGTVLDSMSRPDQRVRYRWRWSPLLRRGRCTIVCMYAFSKFVWDTWLSLPRPAHCKLQDCSNFHRRWYASQCVVPTSHSAYKMMNSDHITQYWLLNILFVATSNTASKPFLTAKELETSQATSCEVAASAFPGSWRHSINSYITSRRGRP